MNVSKLKCMNCCRRRKLTAPSMISILRSISPITIPLIFLFIIVSAAYFLPFSKIMYSMHTVDTKQYNQYLVNREEGAEERPIIAIITEQIPIKLMLVKCIGGVCGSSRDLIQNKLMQLRDASSIIVSDSGGNNQMDAVNEQTGSDPSPWVDSITDDDEIVGHINSISDMVANIIENVFNGDQDNMRDDLQLVSFFRAAVVVIILLGLALMLSILCVAIHFIFLLWTNLVTRNDENITQSHQSSRCARFVTSITTCLSFAICWTSLMASFLYPIITWRGILKREGARYGSGYIIMLVCSLVMCYLDIRNSSKSQSIFMRFFMKWMPCVKGGNFESENESYSDNENDARPSTESETGNFPVLETESDSEVANYSTNYLEDGIHILPNTESGTDYFSNVEADSDDEVTSYSTSYLENGIQILSNPEFEIGDVSVTETDDDEGVMNYSTSYLENDTIGSMDLESQVSIFPMVKLGYDDDMVIHETSSLENRSDEESTTELESDESSI